MVSQDLSDPNSGWIFFVAPFLAWNNWSPLVWSVRLSRQGCELEEKHGRTPNLGVTFQETLSEWPSK